MRNESLDSVKIIWLDRKKVLEDLRRAVKEMAASYPEIEKVILFGSLARGDAVPGSDADLLIILSETSVPFLDRILRYTPLGCGIGVEVFPYTRKEIEQMLQQGNHFIRRALAEGIELFRKG